MLNIITTGVSVIKNKDNSGCLLCGWKEDSILFRLTFISYDCKQIYTIDVCQKCCFDLYDELLALVEIHRSQPEAISN